MKPDRYGCSDTRWRTPLDLAQDVRCVFNGEIMLDPCTEEVNHLRARNFYTEETNGLTSPWMERTWCNPPYGTELHRWFQKAVHEASYGYRIGLLCSVSRTDQDYFQQFAKHASCIQYLRGKLRHSEGKEAMLASWIHWFNVPPETVDKEMGWRGIITVPWSA